MKITRNDGGLITYALGSCVGICVYDPVIRLAGMIHIMLPEAPTRGNMDNMFKYADSGLTEMLRKMDKFGAVRSRSTAKIAGGAKMFDIPGDQSLGNIGKRNGESVKAVLKQQGVRVAREELGGSTARTVEFYAENGMVKIRSYGHADIIL